MGLLHAHRYKRFPCTRGALEALIKSHNKGSPGHARYVGVLSQRGFLHQSFDAAHASRAAVGSSGLVCPVWRTWHTSIQGGIAGRGARETPIRTPREQALQDVCDEARRLHVDIRTGGDAEAFLDWASETQGIPPERMHAAAIGDVIMVRRAHASNIRILREELLHVQQQRAGLEASRSAITAGELAARYALIRHRHQWGLTPEEIREVIVEIRHLKRTGRY